VFFTVYQGNKIKTDEESGAWDRHGQNRNAYRILVGNPEKKVNWENVGVDVKIL
jgi:hypothetical protein